MLYNIVRSASKKEFAKYIKAIGNAYYDERNIKTKQIFLRGFLHGIPGKYRINIS